MAAQGPRVRYGYALATFRGEDFGAEYLSFDQGEALALEECLEDQGWVFGMRLSDRTRGWLPPKYFEPVEGPIGAHPFAAFANGGKGDGPRAPGGPRAAACAADPSRSELEMLRKRRSELEVQRPDLGGDAAGGGIHYPHMGAVNRGDKSIKDIRAQQCLSQLPVGEDPALPSKLLALAPSGASAKGNPGGNPSGNPGTGKGKGSSGHKLGPELQELPAPWRACWSPEQQAFYYFNPSDGKAQWARPEAERLPSSSNSQAAYPSSQVDSMAQAQPSMQEASMQRLAREAPAEPPAPSRALWKEPAEGAAAPLRPSRLEVADRAGGLQRQLQRQELPDRAEGVPPPALGVQPQAGKSGPSLPDGSRSSLHSMLEMTGLPPALERPAPTDGLPQALDRPPLMATKLQAPARATTETSPGADATAPPQVGGRAILTVSSNILMQEPELDTLVGTFVEAGIVNQGRRVFRKEQLILGHEDVEVYIYYWDGRDGPAFQGWWFGPEIGGTQVWAHNKSSDLEPPQTGWKVPWDAAEVRPGALVLARGERPEQDEDSVQQARLAMKPPQVKKVRAESISGPESAQLASFAPRLVPANAPFLQPSAAKQAVAPGKVPPSSELQEPSPAAPSMSQAAPEPSKARQSADVVGDEDAQVENAPGVSYDRSFLLHAGSIFMNMNSESEEKPKEEAPAEDVVGIGVQEREPAEDRPQLDTDYVVAQMVNLAGGKVRVTNLAAATMALGVWSCSHREACEAIVSVVRNRTDLFGPMPEVEGSDIMRLTVVARR